MKDKKPDKKAKGKGVKKVAKKTTNTKKTSKLTKHEKLLKELNELEEHELFQGDGYMKVSNGKLVSYRGFERTIRVQMIGLPEEEVADMLNLSQQFRVLNGRRVSLRRLVHGKGVFLKNAQWEEALERKQEILDMFGKMYSAAEVHKIITTEWGLQTINYNNHILKFQRDNLEVITKLQDEYQKNTSHVRLVHKRPRLDELTFLYQSQKEKYEETGFKSHSEMMLKTLEQIRKEVEGQRLTINGHIQVEHELAVQDHVNNEIFKTLNINDIIISRTCSRIGVQPKYLLYRLQNSYYKKLNGFLPDEMDVDAEMEYPSQVVYDFDRLREKSKALMAEDIEYKEEPKVKDEVKVQSSKEKLLELLKKKKSNMNTQKNNIDKLKGK